jgi:transposase
MNEETVTLGQREQKRAQVLNQLLAGLATGAEAALVLGCSVRQVQRLKAAYQARGPAGLVHGNRGRSTAWALPSAMAAQIAALAEGPYAGVNQQHLTELLAEREGIRVSRSSVRRVLLAAGISPSRSRRRRAPHRRRERMAQEGMLRQADGSRHHWLGADGPELTLIGMIDDATGTVVGAVFRAQEDGVGYLLVLEQIAHGHGIPQALYVDRHGIFQPNTRTPLTLAEEVAGGRAPTQVGRVLNELGIQHIAAHSPQAKGRVERLWGTLQDRLVVELALAGVTTLAAANRFLVDYLPRHNARFAVPAADPAVAYRPVPATLDLAQVFCFKHTRVVRPDNTISFEGAAIQLLATPERSSWVKARVEVHERLDGSRVMVYQGHLIPSRPAPLDALARRIQGGVPVPQVTAVPTPIRSGTAGRPPAAAHPWRQYGRTTASKSQTR